MADTESLEATGRSQVAARHVKAFTRLVDSFHAKVYDYLCWLTRDEALAADLTEETFVRIWEHPPNLHGRGSLRAWVYKVALNVCREHARRNAAPSVPLTEAEESVSDADDEPLARLQREEIQQAVQEAVARLPDLYRPVIVLHSLQGLTLREVAEILDVPVGTAKSRLAAAFELLRRSLHEWKGGPS